MEEQDQTIWSGIKQTIDAYDTQQIEHNPSYAPSIRNVLDMIDYYWMSKYRDGDLDSSGLRKAFYNIVINPTEIAAKMIDLDTKDILVIAEDGQSYYPSWILGKELKLWMKNKKNVNGQTFGQLLNQMIMQFPKYGHLIVKKAKDTVHIVPIQNMYCNPEAKSFLDSDILIEKHPDCTAEFLRGQKKWNQDVVEKLISEFTNNGGVDIYEKYEATKEGNNYLVFPEGGNDEDILFESRINKGDLYKEIKWEDIPCRALGRGQVEKLFEAQIAKNQNENMLRGGYRWTSKHAWQTRDDNVAKNLISEIEDGDVLTVNSEITPISMEERNLGAINLGDNKWTDLIAKLSFSADSGLAGGDPKSGVTLGQTVLQTRMAGQYFDLKREDLGMFVKDILMDWTMPEFKKQKRDIHNLMLGEFDEDELTKLKDMVATSDNNASLISQIKKTGRIPNTQEMEVLKAINKEKINRKKELKIPKGFYEDIKYKIDIVITNEQIDIASRVTTLQTVLQIIGSNPTILKDPKTKKVFYKLLDMAGISPLDFKDEEPNMMDTIGQIQPQRGGSIAKIQQNNGVSASSQISTL